MCRTMNELEKVIADYRSLKAMKEQLEEELKAVEREIIGYMDANEKMTVLVMTSQLNFPPVKEELLTANVWKLTSVPSQSIRESASTEDYTLNKLLILPVEVNRRKVRT